MEAMKAEAAVKDCTYQSWTLREPEADRGGYQETAKTEERAMDPASGISTMQPVEYETKEEHPSPNTASNIPAPRSMTKSLKCDYVELWRATAVPWFESADLSMDNLDENEFFERICMIMGELANEWTVTKAEMGNNARNCVWTPLAMWQSQLKPPNLLKTFIKAVDSCITPFDVRDRVEEQMKTVQASTLVEFDRGQRKKPRAKKAVTPSRPRWTVDVTNLLVLEKRRGADREQLAKRAKYGPGQDDSGALCFVCQQPGHRAHKCPNKKEDSERVDHLRKGKNAVQRFKYKQRKAELKSKRVVKTTVTEEDGKQRWIRHNVVFERKNRQAAQRHSHVTPILRLDVTTPNRDLHLTNIGNLAQALLTTAANLTMEVDHLTRQPPTGDDRRDRRTGNSNARKWRRNWPACERRMHINAHS
ncbi:hypothetical protein H257_14657 [Aphanomyces astaci]|uniref:CCHC-type domain-containing protein n=1 Tax=Aphanomyces astaci TaxID=112090 RepID=W4FS42_APHAT|nr:hypothetical protein H257_14657 [Aphanomyces astaci]ETV69634.1 hypothetical protein H257_14657 [Aphanomyces astaci]|eukprot:XP_009840850.1 hypothetical protein H257_14657 [Aphanomyces astaci]